MRKRRDAHDRAACIAAIYGRAARARDAAHAQVEPLVVIADVDDDVVDRRAAGDVHIRRADKTAHAAAAPAGLMVAVGDAQGIALAAVVIDRIAGDGAVRDARLCVFRAAGGKADQTAHAVPVFAARLVFDDAAAFGVEDDVLKLCARRDAEQTDALHRAVNLDVLDGIRLPVVALGKECRIRVRYGAVQRLGNVVEASDGRKIAHRIAVFQIRVHVVALLPVKSPAERRGDVFVGVDEVRILPDRPAVGLARGIIRRDGIVCRALCPVPVDVLKLRRRADLIGVVFRAGRFGAHRAGQVLRLALERDRAQRHAVGKEGADLVGILRRRPVAQRPGAVLYVAVQVQFARLVRDERIARHLARQLLLRRAHARAGDAVGRRKSRQDRRACLVEIAVAVARDRAAVVMLAAEGIAAAEKVIFLGRNFRPLARADIAEVVAAVAAARFILPVEYAERADVRLHRPVAVVRGLIGGVRDDRREGVIFVHVRAGGVIGRVRGGKIAERQRLQCLAAHRLARGKRGVGVRGGVEGVE